jgi:hypothetical protein
VSFKERMEPLDELFTLFFLFSPIVIGIATSFKMDLRLLWFPMIMFFIWTLYIYWYRGKYQLYEEEELSLIERARGLTYFFSFVATFILNSFVVFYPTWENRLIVIVLVGFSLFVVMVAIPRTFFFKQTNLFNEKQKMTLYKILSLVTSVSIYFSMTVAIINSIMYQHLGFLADIIVLGFLSLPVIFIYQREKKSRKLANDLAISLKDTRWMGRYLGQKKREERKQKRKKTRK